MFSPLPLRYSPLPPVMGPARVGDGSSLRVAGSDEARSKCLEEDGNIGPAPARSALLDPWEQCGRTPC